VHLVGLFHVYSAYDLCLSATCSNSFLTNYFIQTTAKPKQQNIDIYVYFYKKHLNQNMVYGRNTKSIQMAYNNLYTVWAVKSV